MTAAERQTAARLAGPVNAGMGRRVREDEPERTAEHATFLALVPHGHPPAGPQAMLAPRVEVFHRGPDVAGLVRC
jgi:hypothetical protein